jgi:hypothetical protein
MQAATPQTPSVLDRFPSVRELRDELQKSLDRTGELRVAIRLAERLEKGRQCARAEREGRHAG